VRARSVSRQNLRPKAGDEVSVRGFTSKAQVPAIGVTVDGKTVRPRDEKGRPPWMRGPPRYSEPYFA
jgi:hypothetical protein